MKNKYKLQRTFFYFYVAFYYFKLNIQIKSRPQTTVKSQKKNIARLIRRAYKIPFYRERFEKANILPSDIRGVEDLKKLPVLTKEEYREWMIREESKPENEYCMKSKTSGSTGNPTPLLFSPKEYACDIAHALRTWKFCGYNPIWGKTMTRVQKSSEQVGYNTIVQKLGILRREMVDQSRPEAEVIEKINRYKPDLLQMCLPEFIKIALYAKKHDIKIHHPKFVYSLGEVIDERAERIIHESFGDGLMSNYGCAEMGEVSTRKPGKREYYIHNDLYAVDVVSEDGYSVVGERGYVYLTSLYRNEFPLINYDVGDVAILDYVDGRECFTEICGRKNDFFIVEEDKMITYYALDGVVVAFANDVMQMRFIQRKRDEILVQVVKDPNSKKTKDELREEITERLKQAVSPKVLYSYEWIDEIPLGENGKFKMMIKEMQET